MPCQCQAMCPGFRTQQTKCNSTRPNRVWVSLNFMSLRRKSPGSLGFRDEDDAEAEDEVGDERADAFGETTTGAAVGRERVLGATADDFDALRVRGRSLRIGRGSAL